MEQDKEGASEVRGQAFGYIGAALGLVAGLAWSDAIKALIEAMLPLGKDSLWGLFIYAIAVTVVVVIAISYLNKLTKKK